MLLYNEDGKVKDFTGSRELIHFRFLAEHKNLSKEFIVKYLDEFDIILICKHQDLDDDIIHFLRDRYPSEFITLCDVIFEHQNVSPGIAEEYLPYINFSRLSRNKKLSTDFWESEFVEENYETLFEPRIADFIKHSNITGFIIERKLMKPEFLSDVLKYQFENLSEDFFLRNEDVIPWKDVVYYDMFSEETLMKFKDKINWNEVEWENKSHGFIRKLKDKISKYHWDVISKRRPLTKEFIEEFKDKLTLQIMKHNPSLRLYMLGMKEERITRDFLKYEICYSHLQEEEIEKYSHLIDWGTIMFLPNFSDEFKQKHNLL